MHLIVSINGSPRVNSRTGVLLQSIVDAISTQAQVRSESVDLAAESHEIFSGISRDKLTQRGEELVSLAEQADLIVIGSPIYRGSYTGIFKHYFDLIDRDRIANGLAVLAATAGAPHHALAMEHQFRPLMGFFNMQTAATAPFGVDADFTDGRIANKALLNQISRAASEAAFLLTGRTSAKSTVGARQ